MNRVTLGGALHETDLKMELLDYVPVYRTPAGMGGGWVRALALRASRPRKGRRLVMPAMTIERVRAFNGLDVLVARDEGLFEAEGVDLRIEALPPSVPGGPNRCMPRELFAVPDGRRLARLDHWGVLVTYLADVSQG
jgi:hypothetical protein